MLLSSFMVDCIWDSGSFLIRLNFYDGICKVVPVYKVFMWHLGRFSIIFSFYVAPGKISHHIKFLSVAPWKVAHHIKFFMWHLGRFLIISSFVCITWEGFPLYVKFLSGTWEGFPSYQVFVCGTVEGCPSYQVFYVASGKVSHHIKFCVYHLGRFPIICQIFMWHLGRFPIISRFLWHFGRFPIALSFYVSLGFVRDLQYRTLTKCMKRNSLKYLSNKVYNLFVGNIVSRILTENLHLFGEFFNSYKT